MFIDERVIIVKSGDGGDGSVSFRRDKIVQFGGPDGGDGGKGGDVIFIADPNMNTLVDFVPNKLFEAENGEKGMPEKCNGAYGKDCIIKVPVGTMIRDYETNKLLVDLNENNKRVVLLKGGDGGRGNVHFKTATRKVPRIAQAGREGLELKIKLELKLLADVALIGYPSVGKSSFINKVSSAKSKVAHYHFTTLKPKLGVVKIADEESFVMVDLPGLIDGAHKGVGLGDQFLKHMQRCKTLIHIVDISSMEARDPFEDFLRINTELQKFSEKLSKKEQVVFANKLDMIFENKNEIIDTFKNKLINYGIKEENILFGSVLNGVSVKDCVYKIWEIIKNTKEDVIDEEEHLDEILNDISNKKEDWIVNQISEGVFELRGQIVENVLQKYVLLGEDGIIQFLQILRRLGLEKVLEKNGVQKGDTINIAGYEFTYEI